MIFGASHSLAAQSLFLNSNQVSVGDGFSHRKASMSKSHLLNKECMLVMVAYCKCMCLKSAN